MILKEIGIKILGTGIRSAYQACVLIYNSCGELIYEGLTYNGCIYVNLNICEGYVIFINGRGFNKREVFYVKSNTTCYIFNAYEPESRLQDVITFQLTDLNYTNLPIMKGEITLWQRR